MSTQVWPHQIPALILHDHPLPAAEVTWVMFLTAKEVAHAMKNAAHKILNMQGKKTKNFVIKY